MQLFADVMRSYDLPAEEIERQRGGGPPRRLCGAARPRNAPPKPVVECDLGPDCLARRTVTIRGRGARGGGSTIGAAAALRRGGCAVAARDRRRAARQTRSSRPATSWCWRGPRTPSRRRRRSSARHRSTPIAAGRGHGRHSHHGRHRAARSSCTRRPARRCAHLDADPARACRARAAARSVCASATRWVHLRICMSCGHVGCCDSSPNKHATGALPRRRAPDHAIARAGRDVGLVLRGSGRAVRRAAHTAVSSR